MINVITYKEFNYPLSGVMLFTVMIFFANRVIAMPLNCGDHDNFCVYGEEPITFTADNPTVPTPGSRLADRFDTFDTFYFDITTGNNAVISSVTPSIPLTGFGGGVFDNDLDVWWGRYVDLNNDGIYNLLKSDASGNVLPGNIEIVNLPLLDIPSPKYHFHFYTEKDTGNPLHTFDFALQATVPEPSTIILLLAGMGLPTFQFKSQQKFRWSQVKLSVDGFIGKR